MTNGYMVYLLRILAAQGALASVYTDPDDPEGFSAGFVEAVDGQHVLMCDLSPWGQIDGWRVRRNQVFVRKDSCVLSRTCMKSVLNLHLFISEHKVIRMCSILQWTWIFDNGFHRQ